MGDDYYWDVTQFGPVTATMADEDAALLRVLTELRYLRLDGTQVGDAGLAHAAGLAHLQVLTLKNTPVTDAGLVHLKGLSSLEWLDLSGAKVTAAGARDLRQALPKCKIASDFE